MNGNTAATPLQLIESFYDPASGKTYVRHPRKDDEWLDTLLLEDVTKGCPVYSVSGHSDCEVFPSFTQAQERREAVQTNLMLTIMAKRHHEK